MDELINDYMVKLAQAQAAAEEAAAAGAALDAAAEESKYLKRRRMTARVLATLAGAGLGSMLGANIGGARAADRNPFNIGKIKRDALAGGALGALAGGAAGYGANYFKDKALGLDPLVKNVATVR